MIHFVVHEDGDGVGVVVVEGVKAGTELTGWIMEQDTEITGPSALMKTGLETRPNFNIARSPVHTVRADF